MALFSFVGAWADDGVTVGDYTVALSKGWIVAGEAVPTATVEKDGAAVEAKTIGVFDADGVAATTDAAGNYYLKIVVDGDQLLIPFGVAAADQTKLQTEWVWNQETWNSSTVFSTNMYFHPQVCPFFDLYRENPYFVGNKTPEEWANMTDDEKNSYSHDWLAIAKSPVNRDKMFPQITYVISSLEEGDAFNLVARYTTDGGQTWNESFTQLDDETMEPQVYAYIEGYPNAKQFWMVPIPQLFAGKLPMVSGGDEVDFESDYRLAFNQDGAQVNPTSGEILTPNSTLADAVAANLTYDDVQLFLLPVQTLVPQLVAAEDFDWSLTPASVAYSGEAQAPEIMVGETSLDESGYVAKYYLDDEEVDEMVDAGTYDIQLGLNIEGESDTEFVPVGDSKEFTIAQTKIIITPSYVYKKYGQPDPEKPNFELASGQNMTDAQRAEILPFVFLKRLPGQEGEDKGMYEYFIDVVRDQSANNYEIAVTNNYSYLVVDPIPVTVALDQEGMSKIYGFEDPDFKPYLTISSAEYTYVPVYPIPEADDDEADDEEDEVLSDEEQAIYDAELAAMEEIYNNLTITRDGGVGSDPRKEDVGFYDFKATLGGSNTANYTLVTANLGQFEIQPYDITFVPAVADDPATADVDESKPADYKEKFVISVDDAEYDGTAKNQVPTVKFVHDVLGDITLYDPATVVTPAVPATETTDAQDAVYGNDYTYGGWKENTNVTRNTTTWLAEAAATVTVYAHNPEAEEEDGLNPNIVGQKDANFKITPATLTIGFGEYTKVYGQNDSQAKDADGNVVTNITNPQYTGFKTDADKTAATTNNGASFFITKPQFSRVEGENVGTYKIYAVEQGTVNKTVGTAQNYDLTSTDGKLTITAAKLTITAENLGKFYNTDDPEKFTYTVAGLQFEDEFDNDLVLFEREEGEAVGTYAIKPLANAPTTYSIESDEKTYENYTIEYVNGTFTISAGEGQLFIIADDNSKVYGQSDPELTWHAELITGYDEDNKPIYEEIDLTDEIPEGTTITVKRAEGEDATRTAEGFDDDDPEKAYTINVVVTKTITNGNQTTTISYTNTFPDAIAGYNPVAVPGHFYISKAELHVQPVATTIKYGLEPAYDIELTVDNNGKTDLKNNDQWLGNTNVKAQILATLDEDERYSGYPIYDEDGEIAQDGPGTYTITINGGDIKNYVVHYVPGTLTVAAGGLTIWAMDQTVDYPAPANEAYSTPEANLVPVAGTTIGVLDLEGVLPEGFDFSTIVELSCDATKVGTNEGAITIAVKDGVTEYDITLDNPNNAAEDNNGAGNFTVNPLTEIHLAYENVAQALEDHKGVGADNDQEMTVYLPARNLKYDQWYAFVLPFEFTVPELSNKLYYGVVDVLKEGSNTQDVSFGVTIGGIDANQPFLLKVAEAKTADQLKEIFFEGVTIGDGDDFAYNDVDASPYREDAAGNKFIGQYTGKEGLTSYEYYMAQGEFWKGSENITLKPTVAYVQFPSAEAAANARFIVEEADGTTTVINGVELNGNADDADGWYTISGVKLNAKPTQKGAYIKDGKKVFIK